MTLPLSINLGDYSSSNGSLTLNLINPKLVNGSTYYYLDASGNGAVDTTGGMHSNMDARQHSLLNDLFNNSSGTTSTDRSVIKAGYTLELPNLYELQSVEPLLVVYRPAGAA